jgi:hypothetical protein
MTPDRRAAAVVFAAPAVLLAGLAAHPYLERLPDNAGVAEAVLSGRTRWALVHLTVAVGSALMILAFLVVRSELRGAGEDRWSTVALPALVISSALFAFLPGMEFVPLAAAETGGDVAAAQAAVDEWFTPVLLAAGLTFALGALGYARGIAVAGILSPLGTRVVAGALVVMAAARLTPFGFAQFYVQGVAAVAAMWPLAYLLWRNPVRPAAVG